MMTRLPPLRLNPDREFLHDLRLWAGMTLGGVLVVLAVVYVCIAWFMGDAGWVVP